MTNKDWTMAGIFADEGITGTSAQKRPEFLKMIRQCRQKKIDVILTKSISRFARNTVDCLKYVRALKELGIAIIFEKEGINTLETDSEILLTMLSAFAQAESESISESVKWGIRQAMREGKVRIQYKRLYGFKRGVDGGLEIVPEQAVPVDDSYFSDATFIGDSRMEGFRINSGITEGTFLTGVGMDTTNIFQTPFISSPSGNILVFQALYGTDCEKFYVLLGTNELGTYDWSEFKENYRIVLGELKKLSPNALIYVMSVPYVEEDKVTTGDYINNENVDTMNRVILELCEENGYHFLNINEVLSNGNHSLIEGATSDGVHMYPQYCEIWLNYLKNHYVPQDQEGEET